MWFTYPCFKKSTHARMGKGRGKFLKLMYYIKRGSILFEFSNIKFNILKSMFLSDEFYAKI